MPRSCCVPGCKSNYYKEYVPAFAFPSDETKRKLWMSKIPRGNLVITKNSVVCIKHFAEEFIVRESRATRLDGSELVVPRRKLGVSDNAYPSIFPGSPENLTSDAIAQGSGSEDRKRKCTERENYREKKKK